MKCKDCIHCQWEDDDAWCDAYKFSNRSAITGETPACEVFKKQIPHTCGECWYNMKGEEEGDLDYCIAHDLYDFTHSERKACEDFRKGYEND